MAAFVADRLLSALGHPEMFHGADPFDWKGLVCLQEKTNFFFEKRVGEYQKAGVLAPSDETHVFAVDRDF